MFNWIGLPHISMGFITMLMVSLSFEWIVDRSALLLKKTNFEMWSSKGCISFYHFGGYISGVTFKCGQQSSI